MSTLICFALKEEAALLQKIAAEQRQIVAHSANCGILCGGKSSSDRSERFLSLLPQLGGCGNFFPFLFAAPRLRRPHLFTLPGQKQRLLFANSRRTLWPRLALKMLKFIGKQARID